VRYRIIHTTQYEYSDPVSLCHNVAHLRPRNLPGQVCIRSGLRIDPAPAARDEYDDFFGNQTSYFAIQRSHRRLQVTAESEVEVLPQGSPLFFVPSPPWEQLRAESAMSAPADDGQALLFTLESPLIPREPSLAGYAAPSFGSGRPVIEAVEDLMRRIYQDFAYDPHFSTVATPLQDVLRHRRGVCQDFAHLAIGCIRAVGLAARYVSGYLETQPPPGQPRLQGADATHAWFSVFVPEQGWWDFDPTNNQVPREQHVTTAVGRDFSDVTPLKGVLYGGGDHALEVAVDVERLDD